MAEQRAEWYRGTSSWVWGILALFAAAVVIVLDLLDGWHLAVLAGALLFALLSYVAIIRPRVGVQDGDLVLHHMYSTQRIPVAAVETVSVGRTLEVTAGGRHYISAAVGRTLRQAFKGSGPRDPQKNYADFVEDRVLWHASDARQAAGIQQDSPEQFALAEDVRRTWAWPWIGATVVLVVLLVVAVLV